MARSLKIVSWRPCCCEIIGLVDALVRVADGGVFPGSKVQDDFVGKCSAWLPGRGGAGAWPSAAGCSTIAMGYSFSAGCRAWIEEALKAAALALCRHHASAQLDARNSGFAIGGAFGVENISTYRFPEHGVVGWCAGWARQ